MHVGAYHGGTVPFDEIIQGTSIGPFHIYTQSDSDSPELFVTSVSSDNIVWQQSAATGVNFPLAECGNPNSYYGFQFESETAPLHVCPNPGNSAIIQRPTPNLTPNTTYSMFAYLQDKNGFVIGADTETAVTLQATPTGVTVSNIWES